MPKHTGHKDRTTLSCWQTAQSTCADDASFAATKVRYASKHVSHNRNPHAVCTDLSGLLVAVTIPGFKPI